MRSKLFFLLALLLFAICTLYACTATHSMIRKHPESLEGITLCTECHSGSLGAMNHRATDFYKKHGIYSGISAQACVICHQESFCSDCHSRKEGNKPSAKFFTDAPERTLPHRGDYLSQHRIDGRINPVLCAKCHGRQNNQGCTSCHR
jgi:hypothetical protein